MIQAGRAGVSPSRRVTGVGSRRGSRPGYNGERHGSDDNESGYADCGGHPGAAAGGRRDARLCDAPGFSPKIMSIPSF